MQRRQFVRLAAAGTTGALGLGATTGCGGGSGDGKQVTLRLVAADFGVEEDGSTQAFWKWAVDAFQNRNPNIRVDVTVHRPQLIEARVAELVRSGRPPDIAQSNAFADYADRAELYSASELLTIPVQADFPTQLVEAGELHRVQYGIPFAATTRLFFYNKTLFQEAGLDPERPPRSWRELAEAALELKEAGVPVPYGLPLGPEEAQSEALIWMLSNHGGYTDDVHSYIIDSQENVKTFTWLRDELVGRGLTQENPSGTNRAELFDRFVQSEVGMLNGHPSLMAQADAESVDYGVAMVPGNGGRSPATMGVSDWLMALKANDHRDEISLFLNFLYTGKYIRSFAERYQLLPVTISASEWMRGQKKYRKLWPFIDELDTAEFAPVAKASWGKTSTQVRHEIGQAVTKRGNPGSVLATLQSRAMREDSIAQEMS